MKKSLIIAYVIMLHIIIAVLVIQPQFINDQRWRLGLARPEPSTFATATHQMYRAIDRQASDGAIVLIGDSHFQRMSSDLLPENTLNFGIGGDTVRYMADRAGDYQSLAKARAIVVWGGYNDLLRRDPEVIDRDMEQLVRELPEDRPVYLLGLAPIGKQNPHEITGADIETLNERFAMRCRASCRFISIGAALSSESGGLAKQYDSGDGIHLNRTGNQVVASLIKEQVE